MTNKVNPFFIRITEDMTPQMVQDAFDKCVDAGAVANESIDDTKARYKYFIAYLPSFDYFGVNEDFETHLNNGRCNYGAKAQEITLDQLDGWLGLNAEQEWNGEGLPPVGFECEFKENSPSGVSVFSDWSKCSVLSYNRPRESSSELQIIIRDDRGDAAIIYSCDEPVFRKQETPEQKAEREKKEAIDEIKGTIDFFADSYMSALSLYEQGYRKQ